MLEKAKNLYDEAMGLKRLCIKLMVDDDMLQNIDAERFEFITKIMNLVDTSMELVVEQTKLFDEMDKKLDRLIEKLEA